MLLPADCWTSLIEKTTFCHALARASIFSATSCTEDVQKMYRRCAHSLILLCLQNHMQMNASKWPAVRSPFVGFPCAVKWRKDNVWYRAVVVKVLTKTAVAVGVVGDKAKPTVRVSVVYFLSLTLMLRSLRGSLMGLIAYSSSYFCPRRN